MTIFTFKDAPEKEAFLAWQTFLIDENKRIGVEVDGHKVGNRVTGKPDGKFGDGSFAGFEQLSLLAQKDGGKSSPDSGYSRENLAHIQKYLEKRFDHDVATRMMTHLYTLVKPDQTEPSLFRQAYSTLSGNTGNSWRLAADKLSPPLVLGKSATIVVVGRKNAYHTRRLAESYNRAATTTSAPTPDAQPRIVSVVYSAETHTKIEMDWAEYQRIREIGPNQRNNLERAKYAAYTEAENAALTANGYDELKAQKADLNRNPAEMLAGLTAKRAAAQARLSKIDKNILDQTGLTVLVNGHKTTLDGTLRQAMENVGSPSFFESDRTKAYREALQQKYGELKASQGYNAQRKVVDELNHKVTNFSRDMIAQNTGIDAKMDKIMQKTHATPLEIVLPNDILPQKAHIMASAVSKIDTATHGPRG